MNGWEYYVTIEAGKFFNIWKITVSQYLSPFIDYLSKSDVGQIEHGI